MEQTTLTLKHLEKNKAKVEGLRPIDDIFFQKLAESPEVCEEILQVILHDPDLRVVEVTPQDSIKNLQGRSVILDALCIMGDGQSCNLEVQRSKPEDHLRRGRYYASCITANVTDAGESFKDIPNVRVVYISEKDVLKGHKTLYHLEHVLRETRTVVDTGEEMIFVNTEIDDGSDVAELMQCFLQTDVNHPKFPKLSERVTYFKHSEEGVRTMCAISEEWKAEGREEGILLGIAQGKRDMTINYYIKGYLPLEVALEECQMTESDFLDIVKSYKMPPQTEELLQS